MLLRKCLAAVAVALLAGPAAAGTVTVRTAALGDVAVVAPDREPTAFVVLVSGRSGLDDAARAATQALVAGGAAVATLPLPDLVAALEASDKGCHYAFGAFEDLARVAERSLGMTTWRWPVLLGLGEGGSVAYLSLAQAPQNTAAGAVSVGFSATLAMDGSFCPGAPVATVAVRATTYAPRPTLPAPWVYVGPRAPGPGIAPFVATGTAVVAQDTVAAGVAEALKLAAAPANSLADLPLAELPAQGATTLAVFVSGDGGWRDLDKTIGEDLAAHGIAVVGLDSLRYFWSAKPPEQVAADLDRIVAHYGAAWGTTRVALLGYSFGADIMPLAFPHLSRATQDRTVLIGLLGLARSATLEVTVAGWLGLAASDAIDLAPAVAGLPKDRLVCVYGRDEAADGGTGCTLPEMAGATVVETGGGHHFDGDYAAIAAKLRSRLAP